MTDLNNYDFQSGLTAEECRALAKIARSKAANAGRACLDNPLSGDSSLNEAVAFLAASTSLRLHANRLDDIGGSDDED